MFTASMHLVLASDDRRTLEQMLRHTMLSQAIATRARVVLPRAGRRHGLSAAREAKIVRLTIQRESRSRLRNKGVLHHRAVHRAADECGGVPRRREDRSRLHCARDLHLDDGSHANACALHQTAQRNLPAMCEAIPRRHPSHACST